MNLGQLRTLAVSWLDDPNETYFTPEQLNVWLNNAQREVQKQLVQSGEDFYVVPVYAYMTTQVGSYVLPTDFLKVSKLEIVTSGSGVTESKNMLQPVTLVQLDQVSECVGTPIAYTIKRNCFSVRPYPQQAFKMVLNYSYQVSDMVNDADIPDVPTRYQEYIAVLAGLDGFIKDGRAMDQLLAKKDWYLSLMKQDAQERNIDCPREVICDDDYGGWYGGLF